MGLESQGIVSAWSAQHGWGVIDSDDTPGGCWAHFSAISGDGSLYRSLSAGQDVSFTWEVAQQDGFAFRAFRVGPSIPVRDSENVSSEAYRSIVTITFDANEPPST